MDCVAFRGGFRTISAKLGQNGDLLIALRFLFQNQQGGVDLDFGMFQRDPSNEPSSGDE